MNSQSDRNSNYSYFCRYFQVTNRLHTIYYSTGNIGMHLKYVLNSLFLMKY